MLHSFAVGLGMALTFFVVCASLYVIGFAVCGIYKRPYSAPCGRDTRFLVFVPAHNEGKGIQATLASLQRADYPRDRVRIIVIADNCTDGTAGEARACGVEVWARDDASNPGKGQALTWAFQKVNFTFDLAAIVDADTEVDPSFFLYMDRAYAACVRRGRRDVALQGRYLFRRVSRAASWFEQFTIASKAAENSFTYRPRTALGMANLIQGNGFCVSRTALFTAPFVAVSIVEDAEYAVTLALNDIPVVHVDEARVISRMTQRPKDAVSQRLRWASGTVALLFHSVPRLLRGAVRQRRWKLAEMAVMLLFTSRLILVYATLAAITLLFLARPFPIENLLVLLLAGTIALQAFYLYLVFRKADSDPVPFQTIAFMPLYFGYLGAMQVGAVLGLKRKQWSRTAR
ncbi:MAG: glycosyltransferase family 2 protein [Silvibacterium sp.]